MPLFTLWPRITRSLVRLSYYTGGDAGSSPIHCGSFDVAGVRPRFFPTIQAVQDREAKYDQCVDIEFEVLIRTCHPFREPPLDHGTERVPHNRVVLEFAYSFLVTSFVAEAYSCCRGNPFSYMIYFRIGGSPRRSNYLL